MRRHTYLLSALLATSWLISGCNGSVKTSSTSSNATLPPNLESVAIQDRKYYIAKSEAGLNPNKSYKLLLALHGSMQGAISMQEMAILESEANNYLVVYPQSKVEEWNEGCNCNKPHRLGVDDLGYIENIVKDIKEDYNILEDELYAVGFSQGGLFAQNLMCNSQLQFKAIATIAAPMSKQLSESCQIENDTNYLIVQGKKDTVLPYQGQPNGNFALISSEQAIDLIAKQNNIETEAELTSTDKMEQRVYQNDEHINKLVAIEDGQHSWSFVDYNTTKEVIAFFDSVSSKAMDAQSSLYRVDTDEGSKEVHVRSMGLNHQGPAVILLSGFNKNYHADSAWFALLQPLIAKTHRVHVIERLGNGFSSLSDKPSYTSFAPLLEQTLKHLGEQEIIMVSYASSNLLSQAWYNLPDTSTTAVKGMVWIDPDVLLPHSIAHYQDYPVSWFRQVEEHLIPHIEAGKWTERTLGKLEAERTEHQALVSDKYANDVDWSYYDAISQSRASIDKQIIRAREVINYHDDLNTVSEFEITDAVPITIIDTDFELKEIENAEPEYVEGLTKWHQEGTQWSQMIAKRSHGQYIPLENSSHMVTFQHPEAIIEAITHLLK